MELVLLAIAVVIVLVIATVLKARSRATDGYPYIKHGALLSPAERSFLGVLEQAVGAEYRIFAKVRVADVIDPRRGLDRRNRQKALNRTNSKHFDFVLCAPGDLSVVAVVELDDQSHQQRSRQDRDEFLVSACNAASLPLVRIRAQRGYSVPDLRASVVAALGARSDTAPTVETEAPSCPRCSAPMVERQAKSDSGAAGRFWGCTRFPECRGRRAISGGGADVPGPSPR